MAYIYQIFDRHGRSYIGSAIALDGLWEGLVHRARAGEDPDPLLENIRAQGPEVFTVRLLEEVEDQFLSSRIGQWIRRYPQSMLSYVCRRGETFTVTNLRSGENHVMRNLSRFCREHRMSKGAMSQVIQGKRFQHHGWTIKRN